MAKCHNIKIFAWCESCDDQDDFDDSSHYFDNALFAKKKLRIMTMVMVIIFLIILTTFV